MAGRDLSGASRENGRRARGAHAALAITAVSLLAIGIAIGNRIDSQPSPADALHRMVRNKARDDAPRRPGAVLSERTARGAIAAAARSITAFDGDILLQPTRLQGVVSRIASRAARPQLLALFAQASALTQAKLGADTVPRPVILAVGSGRLPGRAVLAERGDRLGLVRGNRRKRRDSRASAIVAHADRLARLGAPRLEGRLVCERPRTSAAALEHRTRRDAG